MTPAQRLMAKIDEAGTLLAELQKREGFTPQQRVHHDVLAESIEAFKAEVEFGGANDALAHELMDDVEATIAGLEKWLAEPLPSTNEQAKSS